MRRGERETRAEGLPPALGGALTVQVAPEAKEWLLGALAGGGPVRLDLGALQEVDLTGLQLLCAAHRWAGERGTELTIDAPPALRQAARRGGFARHRGCREGCLWVEGGP